MSKHDTSSARTVKISEARNLIKTAMRKQRPVFLWGPPGVGKSDLVAQIAEEMDGAMIDVRLNLWEPTDIKGKVSFCGTACTKPYNSEVEAW